MPIYDELILLANKNKLDNPQYQAKLSTFLTAIEQATVYISNHPQEAWQTFISYKPQGIG